MKFLITDGLDEFAKEKIKEMGHIIHEEHYSNEDLHKEIKNCDAVIIRSATKIKKDIIDSANETGRLKLIIRAGVGTDNIDVEYACLKGITVRNTPNSNSQAVAELALAHMLALSRFLNISNVTMRQGIWDKKKYTGCELYGKTLGLIGFGKIAKALAKIAKAFNMNVIYTNKSGEKKEYGEYKYVSLEELIRTSDYISLHMPFDPDAGPVIKEDEFKQMKDGAYIINTSRGGLICEESLLEALESGKIAGAGIDVFTEEPTKNIELVSHPKVSATPHTGGSTHEAQYKIGLEIIEIIKNWEEC